MAGVILPEMRAMVLKISGQPLQLTRLPRPEPGPEEVLIRVEACAVCRTDLHIVDGELPGPKLPLVPGHEIIGEVVECGTAVEDLAPGRRVGVPWLAYACGQCARCISGRENLCDKAAFTGYQVDGGYAEYTVAHHRFAFPIVQDVDPVGAAPLMCAGLIGYRSLRMAGDAKRLGIYGFGAAAHIVTQLAVHQGREVYAFTREGDTEAQEFARRLGAVWAGSSREPAPDMLDAAIIYAPVGELVPQALASVGKGGAVICAGIHMSDIPTFPYAILWGERSIHSVANLTRRDGEEFLALAPQVPIRPETEIFALEDANTALERLRSGQVRGAAVIRLAA